MQDDSYEPGTASSRPDETDPETAEESSGTTVLELFGIKLNVSNPRLAEVLTMEAKDALQSDVRELMDGTALRRQRMDAEQAAPEVLLAPHTAKDADGERIRGEIRRRVDAAATALGFNVQPNGVWISSTDVMLYTRVVDRPVSLAAAVDVVAKLDALVREQSETDALSLVVVDSQETADVFRVAIRQRKLYDRMRTIAIDNLEFVRTLFVAGVVDHAAAVVLLAPTENIDVGEILSIVRAAAVDERDGESFAP